MPHCPLLKAVRPKQPTPIADIVAVFLLSFFFTAAAPRLSLSLSLSLSLAAVFLAISTYLEKTNGHKYLFYAANKRILLISTPESRTTFSKAPFQKE
jgi:hypothetical protein